MSERLEGEPIAPCRVAGAAGARAAALIPGASVVVIGTVAGRGALTARLLAGVEAVVPPGEVAATRVVVDPTRQEILAT